MGALFLFISSEHIVPPPRRFHVICATLISVMGSLVLSQRICLSLFTQCPCPRKLPSIGPRWKPKHPRRDFHSHPYALIETGDLPGCYQEFLFTSASLCPLYFSKELML